VPYYRLYLLNPHNGHIDSAEDFHTADDVEAICLVNYRQDSVPTELWCGGRKVARFDAWPEMATTVNPRSSNRVTGW
jgi:hypothetical protein